MWFITISPKGILKDYFDNLSEEAKNIEEYANKSFEIFQNDKFNQHPTSIMGLILDYPIENTIALLKE
jgi:hypothetical protein